MTSGKFLNFPGSWFLQHYAQDVLFLVYENPNIVYLESHNCVTKVRDKIIAFTNLYMEKLNVFLKLEA